MKAFQFSSGRGLHVIDLPTPRPAPGEVLVRMLRVGIGPKDFPSTNVKGDRIPGREFVGVVEEVSDAPGRPSLRAWIAKRVVGSALLVCGTCDRCRSGLSVHCRARRELGEPGRPGCFAEYLTIPASNLTEVPAHVADDDAVLATPLAAASHLARAIPPTSKPFITVLGDNAIALLTALLISRNKDTVRMLTGQPASASVCEKWGLRHRPLADAGRRQDQDVVIDATGTAQGLALAMELVRPRGRIILSHEARRDPESTEYTPYHVLAAAASQEIEVIGARGEDYAGAIMQLGNNTLSPAPLVTGRFPFSQTLQAVEQAELPTQIKVNISLP